MKKENGKRLAGEKVSSPHNKGTRKNGRKKKKSILTKQQKLLMVIAVVLAVALAGVAAYRQLFARPELSNGEQSGHGGGTQTDEDAGAIDYGDGVRPRAGGTRKSEDYYTVLVLGRDTGGGGNTDTMLLASYDVTNQNATVMSIPRDTMVNIPYDVKKINAVYNYGGGGEKGIQSLYKEISQLVGFEPDYSVVVEWEAVGKIVDAIGGVYFDVPYEMNYHDPYQDLVIEQAKGYRLLDGEAAMQVIRWRQNDDGFKVGDDGRMKIQQDFLKAVIKQMMTPKVVLKLGEIAKVFEENVETDLSFQNILWFAKSAFQGGLSLENVSFTTMPFNYASAFSRTYSKQLGRAHYLAYVVPDADKLLELVNSSLSPFTESFRKSDLDIMFVNKDGSIGSTTGYVEDTKAAVPPDLSPYQAQTPEEPTYEMDENGNLIDPETGEIVPPAEDSGAGTTTPDGTEADDPYLPTAPDDSEASTGTENTDENAGQKGEEITGVGEPAAEPDVPQEPDTPLDPDEEFSVTTAAAAERKEF